ncbi:hypothetical protein BEH94_08030 [Candidatus Altiarchaeales archaeon WOR_SM1_SCG]|nr:hypothetical protein BEH94_08030 [Candidatus Altiarchaeales archaeon WOR_SM1_SCG]
MVWVHISIYKKFRAVVFSNGDEIFSGLIRDKNSPMIMAFLKEFGCEPVFMGTVPDDFEKVKKKILAGTKYDIVVTSGGVSVGKKIFKKDEAYNVSVVASSPRSLISNGYIITRKDIDKGTLVDVNLFF